MCRRTPLGGTGIPHLNNHDFFDPRGFQRGRVNNQPPPPPNEKRKCLVPGFDCLGRNRNSLFSDIRLWFRCTADQAVSWLPKDGG